MPDEESLFLTRAEERPCSFSVCPRMRKVNGLTNRDSRFIPWDWTILPFTAMLFDQYFFRVRPWLKGAVCGAFAAIGCVFCLLPAMNKSSTVELLRSDRIFPWVILPVIFVMPCFCASCTYSARSGSISCSLKSPRSPCRSKAPCGSLFANPAAMQGRCSCRYWGGYGEGAEGFGGTGICAYARNTVS